MTKREKKEVGKEKKIERGSPDLLFVIGVINNCLRKYLILLIPQAGHHRN